MVTGINTFKNHFIDFTNSYILIGGAACDFWFTGLGINFRATKDLDIILIVEALKKTFIERFWHFIIEGQYEIIQKSSGEPCFYRFIKPKTLDYPSQLELFSRKPDILGNFENAHITPIPAEDELSSLSAILLNDDYYNFTIKNSDIVDDLHLAKTETLICLKSKAFTDLAQRNLKGEKIDSKDIKKHLNDVIKLTLTIPGNIQINLSETLKADKNLFFETMRNYNPDFQLIGKDFGLPKFSESDFIQLYHTIFQ
jgi:hypothetical protein